MAFTIRMAFQKEKQVMIPSSNKYITQGAGRYVSSNMPPFDQRNEMFKRPFWDSKKLLPKRRQRLYDRILEVALSLGVGVVEADEIDRINIGRATQKAMAMAVRLMHREPDMLLIDGVSPVPLPIAQRTIVKGDGLCVSIAAASIVAKVSRDGIMMTYHEKYPQYNFARHKGYGTREHLEAIRTHGCCKCHRRSFRGVKDSGPDSV